MSDEDKQYSRRSQVEATTSEVHRHHHHHHHRHHRRHRSREGEQESLRQPAGFQKTFSCYDEKVEVKYVY